MNYIERYESKITTFDYFAVDIDDENIILNNEKYMLGYISNCIANLPKEYTTNLLIHSGKINHHWQELKLKGYSRKLFMDIFADINKMIDYMQLLEPFKYFDMEESRATVSKLFGEDALDDYEYLLKHLKIKYATTDENEITKLNEIENKSKTAENDTKIGDIIIKNIADTGSDIVATKSL